MIALQEVALLSRDGDLVDNAGDLGRQLGMDIRLGAVRTFAVTDGDALTGVGCFGNALLSRIPIERARAVGLPQAPMNALVEPAGASHPLAGVRYADALSAIREPRCLLLADINGVTVGTTHLSHIGAAERGLQAAAARVAFDGHVAEPALLLGDLNAEAGSSELAPFEDWTDGFTAPAGDDVRISTVDGRRLDHILARHVSVETCRVARESGDLSDHYPLVADVAFQRDTSSDDEPGA